MRILRTLIILIAFLFVSCATKIASYQPCCCSDCVDCSETPTDPVDPVDPTNPPSFDCPANLSWCVNSNKQVIKKSDIRYGSATNFGSGKEETLLLDTYSLPYAGKKRPVMVVIHGGGYSITSTKTTGWAPWVSELFAKRGFFVASIEYRRNREVCKQKKCWSLKPSPLFQHPVHDTKSAIRYIRKNATALKIDSNKIGLFGCSAGGRTTIDTLAQNWGEGSSGNSGYSSKASAGIGLSGTISDFSQLKTRGIAPYIDFHNTIDNLVPYKGALDTKKYLDSIGSVNYLHTIAGKGHCPNIFGLPQGQTAEFKKMMGFLIHYMNL